MRRVTASNRNETGSACNAAVNSHRSSTITEHRHSFIRAQFPVSEVIIPKDGDTSFRHRLHEASAEQQLHGHRIKRRTNDWKVF